MTDTINSLPLATSPDDILNTMDAKTTVVPVPEWNFSLLIQVPTVGESAAIRQRCLKMDGKGNVTLDQERFDLERFITAVRNPQTGKPLFTAAEHYHALKRKSASAMQRVLKNLTELTGDGEEDVKAAEEQFQE
jgi:hypothetical protein